MSFPGSIAELLVMQKETKLPLPSNIAPLIGDHDWGPNCWNATIMWHDQYEEARHVGPYEMEEWMDINTMAIQFNERQYGDVMVFRLQGELVHTAIWMDPDTIFHKIGFSGPWVIQSSDQFEEVYSGDYDLVEFRRYIGSQEKVA